MEKIMGSLEDHNKKQKPKNHLGPMPTRDTPNPNVTQIYTF